MPQARYQRVCKKRLFLIRGDVHYAQKINSHILIIVEKCCNSDIIITCF